MTAMRTAPRELDHHGPAFSVVGVTAMINQLPSNAIRIQVSDRRCRGIHNDALLTSSALPEALYPGDGPGAEHNSKDSFQGLPLLKGRHEANHDFLALTSDNKVNRRFLPQDLLPVVGGEYTAVNDPCGRKGNS